MSFTLAIATDNSAFEDDPRAEIARILRDAADKITAGQDNGGLRDNNGNTVGHFEFTDVEADITDDDNEDQDEAENIAQNVETLYDLGRSGDVAALEAAFREYVQSAKGNWVDPNNVDFDALAEFLQE